jgi:hypothetical protein
MPKPDNAPDAKPRGFTNDGKVGAEIVNDSYGTVDPADSSGLEEGADHEANSPGKGSRREIEKASASGRDSAPRKSRKDADD